MMRRVDAAVGYVYGDKHLPISRALSDIIGHPPREERLGGYAGPNDFLQILMDWSSWQVLGAFFAASFGAPFLKKLGELSAENSFAALKRLLAKEGHSDASAQDAKKFEQLGKAITQIIADGHAVTIGLPTHGAILNNISIELKSGDLAALLDGAAVLAEIGEDLCRTIESEQRRGNAIYGEAHNPDRSAKIERMEDGSTLVRLVVVKDGQANPRGESVPLTLRYDKTGQRT